MRRIIMHVDLDSFYASAEEIRKPDIKGKAIVICMYSGRTEDSGAVSASNYKARELGIRSGMPIAFAKKKAKDKDVVFLPADRDYYNEVSGRIMEILETEADVMEQVSVDEAYLDVSVKCGGSLEKAAKLAQKIKDEIKEKEKLTCSVGIGPNKLAAKMASKKQKPDGLTAVAENDALAFVQSFPLDKLHGIGDKTIGMLEGIGVKTIKELSEADVQVLQEMFGERKGFIFHNKSLAIDDDPVLPREKKQLSRLATLEEDTGDAKKIFSKISELAADLQRRVKAAGISFRTVSVIFITKTLETQTRSETTELTSDIGSVLPAAEKLIRHFVAENPGLKMRRVGIRVSNFVRKNSEKEVEGQKSLSGFLGGRKNKMGDGI